MFEALSTLLNYGLNQPQLRTSYADVDDLNDPSRGLLTRLGFQPVAGEATLFMLTPELLQA